jgi:hypothetical protein
VKDCISDIKDIAFYLPKNKSCYTLVVPYFSFLLVAVALVKPHTSSMQVQRELALM